MTLSKCPYCGRRMRLTGGSAGATIYEDDGFPTDFQETETRKCGYCGTRSEAKVHYIPGAVIMGARDER